MTFVDALEDDDAGSKALLIASRTPGLFANGFPRRCHPTLRPQDLTERLDFVWAPMGEGGNYLVGSAAMKNKRQR